MINTGNKIWKCAVCGSYTSTLHEIFNGNGRRHISVTFNLQVPLCQPHHSAAHLQHKKQVVWRKIFCRILGINHDDILLALNQRNYDFIKTQMQKCEKKIKELEI